MWFFNAFTFPSSDPITSCEKGLASFNFTGEVAVGDPNFPFIPFILNAKETHYNCWVNAGDGFWLKAWATVLGPYCPANTIVNADRKSCICGSSTQRYFEDVQSCVDVQADATPLGNANDNSCPKDAPTCGNPIHPGNANKIQRDIDFTGAGGLDLIRTYNGSPYNTDSNTTRLFGKRWTSVYDQRLFVTSNRQRRACYHRLDNNTVFCELYADATTGPSLAAVRDNGKRTVFMKGDSAWTGDANSADRVSATYRSDGSIADYRYTAANGDDTEVYDGSTGRLYSVTSRSGAVRQFIYSDGNTNDTRLGKIALPNAPTCTQVHPGAVLPAGRLLCAVDHWGRQLNFEYDGKGRVTQVTDPAGQTWRYEYDGASGGCASASATNSACAADNLTKVTYPDGNRKTYHYNEAAAIKILEAVGMRALSDMDEAVEQVVRLARGAA